MAVITGTPNHDGAVDPTAVSMGGVQAVIALVGVSMVLGTIWFFFWAKNGGFQWRKGDWDDYKSTVLRRKGPNGTTLSNATKSTILGGGSVVGDGYSDRDTNPYMDETSTQYTGTMTELSSSTAPIIKEKQSTYTGDKRSRRKKSRQYPEMTAKEKKQQDMAQAQFEGGHDADVRAYMKERPARVGGINTTGDTMHYGTDYTDTEPSVAHTASHYKPAQPQSQSHYSTPPSAPPSVPQHKKQPSREARNSRRDFSYTIGGQQEQAQFSVAPTQRSASPPPLRVPARASQQQSNTKTYHHPLPNLRAEYNNSPAGGRGGYRRGADSDLGD